METERRHAREALSGKRGELTRAEDRMYQACGAMSYDQALAKATAAVDKLQVIKILATYSNSGKKVL